MSAKPITVVCVSGDQWGTNYYRARLVKRGLERRDDLGMNFVHTHLFGPGLAQSADVLYVLRPMPQTVPIGVLHALKRSGKPIVVDWDDDVFNIPEWSMSGFALDKKAVRDYYSALMKLADLVTTTNEYNARERLPQVTDAPVRVIPNALDEQQRLLKPTRPLSFEEAKPNIGWAGGSQHNGDVAALDAVWQECLARGWTLTFLSDVPRSLEGDERFAGQIVQVGGVADVEVYHQALALSCMDVCVAPLLDIPFNRAKSSLKALEYGAIAGAPCVLSDVEAYDDVKEGERVQKLRGFSTREWMSALEKAVEVAKSGKQYVLPERFRLGTTTEQWAAAFREAHQIVTEE